MSQVNIGDYVRCPYLPNSTAGIIGRVGVVTTVYAENKAIVFWKTVWSTWEFDEDLIIQDVDKCLNL